MLDANSLPRFADIEQAARRIAQFAVVTPLLESHALNERVGGRVLIKAEMLQRTGSSSFAARRTGWRSCGPMNWSAESLPTRRVTTARPSPWRDVFLERKPSS